MADVFGDPSLFAEFEKERDPKDTILLSKCVDESPLNTNEKCVNGKLIDIDKDDAVSESSDDLEVEPNVNEEKTTLSLSLPSANGEIKTKQTNSSNINLEKGLGHETSMSHGTRRKDALIEEYESENKRLKSHSKLIDSSKYAVNSDGPVVQVLFMNNKLSRKYRAEIEDFVINLILKEQADGGENLPLVKPGSSCVSFGDRSDSNVVLGCSQFYGDYLVDPMGWPLVGQNPALTDGWPIPFYEQMYKKSYPCNEEDEDDSKPPQRSKAACFNCGGEHTLNECTEVKDMKRINQKRREFRMQNPGQKQSRYITDPRFASFKAGVLSDDLRKALGLRRRQLPPFIYQMRVLGYPPGWLQHAKNEGSGITLFDKDGKEVSMEGESAEDGEVDQKLYPEAQYDISKIVEYPGFNVYPPEDTMDEWQKLGAPPMHPQHRKEVMQMYLSPANAKPGKKRALSQSSEPPHKKAKHDVSDMDICDSGTEDDHRTPGCRTSHQRSTSSDHSSRTNTPTLDDLVSRQRELLAQLEDSEKESGFEMVELEVVDSVGESDDEGLVMRGVSSPSPSARSTDSPFKPPLPPSPLPGDRPPLPMGTPPATPPPTWSGGNPPLPPSPLVSTPPPIPKGTLPPTPQSEEVSLLTPRNLSRSGSIHMDLGTPILSDKSPQLPESSKFAHGITDHLLFENLPNSTGSFVKMQSIIDRIRQSKQKIDI